MLGTFAWVYTAVMTNNIIQNDCKNANDPNAKKTPWYHAGLIPFRATDSQWKIFSGNSLWESKETRLPSSVLDNQQIVRKATRNDMREFIKTQPGGKDMAKVKKTYSITIWSTIAGTGLGFFATLFAGGRANFVNSGSIKYVHAAIGGILGAPTGSLAGYLLGARFTGAYKVDNQVLRWEYFNFLKQKHGGAIEAAPEKKAEQSAHH